MLFVESRTYNARHMLCFRSGGLLQCDVHCGVACLVAISTVCRPYRMLLLGSSRVPESSITWHHYFVKVTGSRLSIVLLSRWPSWRLSEFSAWQPNAWTSTSGRHCLLPSTLDCVRPVPVARLCLNQRLPPGTDLWHWPVHACGTASLRLSHRQVPWPSKKTAEDILVYDWLWMAGMFPSVIFCELRKAALKRFDFVSPTGCCQPKLVRLRDLIL